MKRILLLMTVLMPFAAQAEWSHPRYGQRYAHQPFWNKIERRLHRQDNRIENGFHDGRLTRKEYRKLQRKHCRLSDRINDLRHQRYLSDHEKRNILSRLDKNSNKIYRLKHNRRYSNIRKNNYYNEHHYDRNDRKVIWTDYGSGGFYFRF